MPSSDSVQRLEDILENVARIEGYTSAMTGVDFLEDLKTRDAVESCLERISEAAKKLGGQTEEMCPGLPWPEIRGLGNFLHQRMTE